MKPKSSLACIVLSMCIWVCGCGEGTPPATESATDQKKSQEIAAKEGVTEPSVEDPEVLVATVKDITFHRDMTFLKESGQEMYRLELCVELPQKAVSFTLGEMKSAITDTGRSVLPKDMVPAHPIALYPSQLLEENGHTCEFSVDLAAPKHKEESLKKVLGELEYVTASGWKVFDTGILEFAPGVESQQGKVTIRHTGFEKDITVVHLKVGFQPSAISCNACNRHVRISNRTSIVPLNKGGFMGDNSKSL